MIDYESFFELSCYDLPQSEKEKKLFSALKQLTEHHIQHCPEYANILSNWQNISTITSIEELPPLSVKLFKNFELLSLDRSEIFKTLTSSGTTGQTVSKIYLDQEAARLQSRALVKILQTFIGEKRLPMLIIDSESINLPTNTFSARAAGIRGLATFGRDHTYLLDDDMQINFERLDAFLEKHSGSSILMFGFTFMVWQYLHKALKTTNRHIDLSKATLIHSGGWKKMLDQAVDNQTFKHSLYASTKLKKIHNFYGMVEQIGSIFMECEFGHLHCPIFADVIIKDIYNNRIQKIGVNGVIEVISILPRSYPGHVLLTEDLGTVHGIDDCACGRKGKYFTILGRIPRAEARGCSDVHAEQVTP